MKGAKTILKKQRAWESISENKSYLLLLGQWLQSMLGNSHNSKPLSKIQKDIYKVFSPDSLKDKWLQYCILKKLETLRRKQSELSQPSYSPKVVSNPLKINWWQLQPLFLGESLLPWPNIFLTHMFISFTESWFLNGSWVIFFLDPSNRFICQEGNTFQEGPWTNSIWKNILKLNNNVSYN